MELKREEFEKTYEIREDLVLGSPGVAVKRATKKNLDGKEYAVKFRELDSSRDCDKKYEREIQHLLKLENENIVKFFNFCPDARLGDIECFAIVMEKCPSTLRKWIKEQNENKEKPMMSRRLDAAEKFYQTCKGVEHMHSEEVVHRDLKPENILIADNGSIKIADFDIAIDRPYTRHTTNKGTAYYMAPEQTGKDYDFPVDIFALGTIFFEMLRDCSTKEILDLQENQLFPDDDRKNIWNLFGLLNRSSGTKQLINNDDKEFIKTMINKSSGKRPLITEVTSYIDNIRKEAEAKLQRREAEAEREIREAEAERQRREAESERQRQEAEAERKRREGTCIQGVFI